MIRNLIYHVTPLANYKWNLEQLAERLHIFNGLKIAAVAQGDGLDNIKEVRKLLPKVDCLPFENNKKIRETATFLPLLRVVKTLAKPSSVTFYGHTKGVTRPDHKAVRLWTETMYKQLLDKIPEVEKALEIYPCVGCFKRYGRFPKFPVTSVWHYAGTFFWFNNTKLFAHKNWDKVEQTIYGTEAYLSTLFGVRESFCLFGDKVVNPYDYGYMKRLIEGGRNENRRQAAVRDLKKESK